MTLTPFQAKIVHTAEAGLAIFAGAAGGYLETLLLDGHVPVTWHDWRAVLAGAAIAGGAAVASRVRGYQFGVVRGVNLMTPPASQEVTPAETPQAKGNVQ